MRQIREPTATRKSPEKRRSESVSTDFLHEGKMYVNGSRDNAVEGEVRTPPETVRYPVIDPDDGRLASQVSAEVPETQEDLGVVVPRGDSLPSWSASDSGNDESKAVDESLQDGKAQENRAGTNEMIM